MDFTQSNVVLVILSVVGCVDTMKISSCCITLILSPKLDLIDKQLSLILLGSKYLIFSNLSK